MARRGFGGTALRAALGAVTGVAEGLQQRDVVAAEKKRMADALARQARMDAFEMEDRVTAKEDRLEAQKDRLQTQRQRALAGGYIPTGRDMPGAVERPFFDEQVIGGQTYRSYLTPGQFARKTAAEAAEFKAQFDPETMTPYQKEMIRQRTLDRLSRERGGAGDMKPPTATDATKEAQGIKFLSDNRSQEVMLALQKAIEVTPALAGRPGLVGYGLMQQAERKARVDAAGKPKAGGRTLSKPPGMGSTATDSTAAADDVFDSEWDRYNKRGK